MELKCQLWNECVHPKLKSFTS